LVITHMFKCDCIDPVFFHRRGRKARREGLFDYLCREGLFDYLCDLCALSGEMWVITRVGNWESVVFRCFDGRSDKSFEKRVRAGGTGFELGMKLAAQHKGMIGQFDDLDQPSVR